MNIEEVKKLPVKERYLFWITERESVRLKKENEEAKPWTDFEVMQKYKFCNVRRMDDRVSRWLFSNWYEPNYNHPNILTACVIARLLNNTDSLQEVGFPSKWNPEKVEKILLARTAKGEKNFAGAYLVTGSKGIPKTSHIVWNVVDALHKKKLKYSRTSIEELVEVLVGCNGLGSFMAGQVAADMRWAALGTWADKDTFATMGPGSHRGMNRFHGRPKEAPIKITKFNEELLALIEFCKKNLPVSIFDRLEAIDIQNCLCEFDKMERTLWEGRRPKQLYRGLN